MRRDTIPARHLLLIPLGFVIWSLGFVTLYATNAFGCAFGWAEPTQRGILLALALGFILMTVLAFWMVSRHKRNSAGAIAPGPSLALLGVYGLGSALFASIVVFLPALTTTMCL